MSTLKLTSRNDSIQSSFVGLRSMSFQLFLIFLQHSKITIIVWALNEHFALKMAGQTIRISQIGIDLVNIGTQNILSFPPYNEFVSQKFIKVGHSSWN